MDPAATAAWRALSVHVDEIRHTHLRELLEDRGRCEQFRVTHDGVLLDCSRQNATVETLHMLLELAEECGLRDSLRAMRSGEAINVTEERAVLHHALRLPRDAQLEVDGDNVVADVHAVLDRIEAFSERVRRGDWRGASGETLTDVVAIGIGGSYLGPEFVHEALRTDPDCAAAAAGRRLRFLANVDPIDITRVLADLDPARTLVVVISKTFTTAETMLNARALREWLRKALGEEAVGTQMVAVSSNLEGVEDFGIDPDNAFGFWDWVGGRYSVCSAVGMLPLALQYGMAPLRRFLAGAHAIDEHCFSAPFAANIPVLLGLFGLWNSSLLGRPARALLPYCQALHRFPAHIQQVDMESNGKRVARDGRELHFAAGEIDFGEPGTNGQHSFYQLLHQGRVVPADFIGFRRSQQPRSVPGQAVDNHDELMANFFAQPDALALGKTVAELSADGVPDRLLPHKTFPGNRPSNVLLLDRLDPYSAGQLLAIYEHRTAVQGFIWGLNSFDQMGVELGKVLAKQVRSTLADKRKRPDAVISGYNPSTEWLLRHYLD